MHLLLIAAAFFALTVIDSASATTRPVNCTLTVEGKTYMGGICEFTTYTSLERHHSE